MSFLDFKTDHFVKIDEIPALLISDPTLYTSFSQKLVTGATMARNDLSRNDTSISLAKSFITNHFKNCNKPDSDYPFCPNTLDFTNFIPQKPIISSEFSISNFRFGQIEASFDGIDLDNGYILEINCPTAGRFKEIVENQTVKQDDYLKMQAKLLIANSLWGIEKILVGYFYQDGIYLENKRTSRISLIRLVLIGVDFDKKCCDEIEKTVNLFVKMLEKREWNPAWNKTNDKH